MVQHALILLLSIICFSGFAQNRRASFFQQQAVAAAAGAPAYDANSAGDNVFGATTVSFTHTVGGSGNYLLVGMLINDTASPSSVTYNGVAMSSLSVTSPSGGIHQEVWALKAPATGAHTVLITFAGSTEAAAVSISYSGVNQTTPTGTPQTDLAFGNPISHSLTSATGELPADFVGMSLTGGTFTQGAGQTIRGSRLAAENIVYSSTSTGAASVTMAWTQSTDRQWFWIGVSLKP